MTKTLKLLTLLMLLGVTADVTVRSEGNPSATGDYVRVIYPPVVPQTAYVHTVFNAVVHKDGIVSGSMSYENSDGLTFTAVIDDVLFSSDGKSAYLHGTFTASSNQSQVGQEFVQKVTDNGEGKRAAGFDTSTAVHYAPVRPLNAAVALMLDGRPPYETIAGNIQVRSR